MEYFLAEGLRIDFGTSVTRVGNLDFRKATFHASWLPLIDHEGQLPNDISNALCEIISGKTLQLEIGCRTGYVSDESVVRISSSESFLEQLYETAHRRGFKVEALLKMKNLNGAKRAITQGSGIGNSGGDKPFSIEWKGFYISSWSAAATWRSKTSFVGALDLAIHLTPSGGGCLPALMLKDMTNKFLNLHIGSDLSIVPSTGRAIPCHRMFLIAHSPALDSLVKGTFGDAKSNFLKMPELSEASVQALMEYIYLGGISKPEENCVLALELYIAAQQYDINGLKAAMRGLLTTKPDSWYKLEMLMKFYISVKSKKEEGDLKMIAVKIIKANFKTVQQLDCYHNFYKDDLEGAKELVSLLVG